MSIELLTLYRHRYDSEWFVSFLTFDRFERVGDTFQRSFLSIGKRDETWFIDLLWVHILPR